MSIGPDDWLRFAGQKRAILERLSKGSATNRELSEIALGFSQRVSELRKAGFDIECDEGAAGYALYTWKRPEPKRDGKQAEIFQAREMFTR